MDPVTRDNSYDQSYDQIDTNVHHHSHILKDTNSPDPSVNGDGTSPIVPLSPAQPNPYTTPSTVIPRTPVNLPNMEPVKPDLPPDEMFAYFTGIQNTSNVFNNHIDPWTLSNQLFDANGYLSSDQLQYALTHYNPHDVYDALIAASTVGGKNLFAPGVLPPGVDPNNIVHTNDLTNAEVTKLVVSYLAYNNASGHYSNTMKGKLPPLLVLQNPPPGDAGFEIAGMSFVGRGYLNSGSGMEAAYHELTHAFTDPVFSSIESSFHMPDEGSTGFLTNLWNHNALTSPNDLQWLSIVRALSDLTRNTGDLADLTWKPSDFDFSNTVADPNQLAKGIRILEQAKYSGDPKAIAEITHLLEQPRPASTPRITV